MRFTVSLFLCLSVPFLMRGQAPVAAFTANVTSGCSPLTVNFQDQSTGTPLSWNWDFGNGQLSNAKNPSIAFASNGASPATYTITLVVRNAGGIDQVTKTAYITVNPSPTVAFKADLTLSCLPAVVNFTDQSVANAGTINKWEWQFRDGTAIDANQNPVHSYAAPGFYDVFLKVTSTTGCSAATTLGRYIRVVNGVKADFDLTGPFTCSQPYNVVFKNLTSGPGTLTYSWDLGNGATSTATDPPTSYATANTYTVKLSAKSQFGCADSIQKSVPVKGISSTYSIGPDTVVCIGAPVSFQSTSSPAPSKVTWDFGDGTASTDLKPPPKSYTAANDYPVKLISNFSSCNDTLIKTVHVTDKPLVDFTGTNLVACKPTLVASFQDISPDATAWKWDFGDGSAPGTGKTVSHSYTKLGEFDVTLTITNKGGCQNTVTKKAFVKLTAPFLYNDGGPTGVCVGKPWVPISYITAPDGVTSYLWDFGDGTTANTELTSHIFTTPGKYDVKLSIVTTGGCTASNHVNIQVGNPPVVDFTADKSVYCRSDIVNFTNLSTPASTPLAPTTVLWTFSDDSVSNLQNPSHKFVDTGFVSVKLKVTSMGCADSLTKSSLVYISPPLADFSYSIPDCANKNTVSFKDLSKTDPSRPPLSYQWNFGDIPLPGVSSTTIGNVPYTYPGPPKDTTYTVTLIINNDVCYDTIARPVQLVGEKAAFDFGGTGSTFCRDSKVVYRSLNNPAFVKTYEWFIDGVADLNLGYHNFPTTFAANGTHSIYLVIRDINDCFDTSAAQTVTIIGPDVLFGADNNGGCKNASIQFRDSSKPATGSIGNWTWDFGDGTPGSSLQNPTHKYADTGVYTVTLTAGDATCTGKFDTTISITKPTAFFSAAQTTFCPGAPLPFKDSSIGTGFRYKWFFGDGGIDSVQNPSHAYVKKDSSYSVKLIVTDTVGCSDSLTRSKYINIKAPKPLFGVKDTTSICAPLETKFTFKGLDYESFSWDFGDSSTSTLPITSHFYNAYGLYTAKLYIVGYGGCVDSAQIPVNVIYPYTATTMTLSPTTACNDLTVHFSLSVPSSTAFNVVLGDGNTDTSGQLSFDHFYSLPNNYNPYVALYDSIGCQTTVGGFGTVRVQGAVPLFGMDKNKFCDSGSVYFANYSQDAVDPIVSRSWDFGDGSPVISVPNDAQHKYAVPGLYVPTLAVTTAAGCTQKFTDTVRVLATPTPLISSNPGVCNDSAINFAGSLLIPPDTAIAWKWDLSGGKTSDVQNPSIHYPDTGVHHITLLATNSLGCKGNTAKDITVYPLPAIKVVGDTTSISGGVGLTLPLTYSSNIVSYLWTPAGTLSCTDCPNPFANPKFSTTYNVKVVDANGCTNSRDVTLIITCNNKNFYIPNTFSPNNDGANDRFYPRGTGLNLIQALRIFNRWGEPVYEKRNFPSNDASSGWDGMYKGKPAPVDTYIYMIDIICDNASVITYKGNITLIR